MSSTGLSDVRHPDDFYVTPVPVTLAILPHLNTLSGLVLDPCAGDGAILDAISSFRPLEEDLVLHGIELDEKRAAQASAGGHSVDHEDALSREPWSLIGEISAVVMNPPFKLAMEFVTRAIAEVPHGDVAALLRLNWLSSKGRSDFHRKHPSDVYILTSRPEFAASLKCKKKCGWEVLQRLNDPRPKHCPCCCEAVTCTTSDSCEYAWFVWGPGRGNRWHLIDVGGTR
jgi:hypothetical protein